MTNTTLTAVAGLSVGHFTDVEAATGCTVILCPEGGCVASGFSLGSSPGTRELALLQPEKTVREVHALVFSGGSAFGLAAAGGVMRWLAERDIGFETPYGPVPIVPAAVIFDLGSGSVRRPPDEAAGYQAAAAASAAPVESGRLGAGTGATVGKLLGPSHASPSGLGSACQQIAGATVAALAVCNAVGNVVDPADGRLLAGTRLASAEAMATRFGASAGTNTTLVAVATDAVIDKAEAHLLAQSAQMGIARVTRPVTVFDGDTTFALSTCRGPEVPLAILSAAAQEVVAAALVDAVKSARGRV